MNADLKAQVSMALYHELGRKFPAVSVEPIDTEDRAHFFGSLMVSALGSSGLRSQVEDGTLIGWALLVDGRPYVVAMTRSADGWEPFKRAFGFANTPTTVADEIDSLWRTVVAGLR